MNDEIQFAKGIFFQTPNANAPDFVLGKISIKRLEAMEWLAGMPGEWVNLDALMSRGGKPYVKVNNYKKGENASGRTQNTEDSTDPYANRGKAPERNSGDSPERNSGDSRGMRAVAQPGQEPVGDQIEYPTEEINPLDIPF